MQHSDKVLGRDVARGAARVWAATEATDRAVELARACLHRGDHICQGHTAGIVEMQAQRRLREPVEELAHECGDLSRVGDANCVAEGDRFGAGIAEALGDVYHAGDIDRALIGAAERRRDVARPQEACFAT